MIIRLGSDRSVMLDNVDVFSALEVRLSAPMSFEELAAALSGVAMLDQHSSHAWVDEEWLKMSAGRTSDSNWRERFSGMLAYAEATGWRRVEPLAAVRAHVTLAAPA